MKTPPFILGLDVELLVDEFAYGGCMSKGSEPDVGQHVELLTYVGWRRIFQQSDRMKIDSHCLHYRAGQLSAWDSVGLIDYFKGLTKLNHRQCSRDLGFFFKAQCRNLGEWIDFCAHLRSFKKFGVCRPLRFAKAP